MANLGTTTTGTTTGTQAEASPISLEVPSGGLLGDSSPTLLVAPDTDSVLTGGEDRDILIGGAGNDDLTGGEGDDILIGGGGRNIHEGGDGTDIFGHAAGAFDIVVDFAPDQDEKLSVSEGLTVTSSEQGTVEANLGTGTTEQAAEIITFSDGSTLALIGVTQQFTSDWLVGSESA
jgi:Ca2+-binding RTX toxin-like protein